MQHVHIELSPEDEAKVVAALKKFAAYGVPATVAAELLSEQFHLGVRYGASAVSGSEVVVMNARKNGEN